MSYFGVININSNECIGTSLSTINHNDTLLDLTIYQLSAVVNNLNTSIDAGLSEPAVGLGQRGYSAYDGAYYTTNKIYTWGNSAGADNRYDSNAPTPEPFYENYLIDYTTLTINKLYSSIYNSFALLSDGTLWGTGYAEYWQNKYPVIGGDYSGLYLPLNIASLSSKKIESFDASEVNDKYVTIGVIVSGTQEAYAWGVNTYKQLGTGDAVTKTSPQKITIGNKTFGQISTGGGAVSDSGANIVVKTTDGLIYACGSNTKGQLGDGTLTQRSTFVECSANIGTLATPIVAKLINVQKIMNSGMQAGFTRYITVGSQKYLYATGNNNSYQLGQGGTVGSAASKLDANLYIKVGSLSGVEKVVTAGGRGTTVVAALLNDGRVFAWGDNRYGAVGTGSSTDITSPTRITLYRKNPNETGTLPYITDIFGSNNTAYGSIGLISNTGELFVAGVNVFPQITMLNGGNTKVSTDTFYRYEKVPLNNVQEGVFYCRPEASTPNVAGAIVRDSNGAVWVWGYNNSFIVHPSTPTGAFKNPRTINKY